MLESKIKSLIEGPLLKLGITVDSVTYVKEGVNNFLRIVIDNNGIMDVDACVNGANTINPILDSEDIINETYILDVCSKGRSSHDE